MQHASGSERHATNIGMAPAPESAFVSPSPLASYPPEAETLLPDPFIGTTLKGTYRIEALMAKGGMGAVYEARHLRLGRPLAVKVLLDREGDEYDRAASFRAEAETMAQLAHPHVVQVLDVDETENGIPYFVMEYLDGETLAARLHRDGPLPVLDALLVTFQTAAALAQVHALGIVHCDLKPGNIFLQRVESERVFVKILDFGVSRAFEPSNGFRAAGLIIGTPNYMAPEQARGDDALDHRADQFALATMAYEMLSGRTAFSGGEAANVLAEVLSVEPPPLSEAAAWLPASFDAVMRRALSKQRKARFPSVSRFAWELGNAAMQAGIDPDASWLPPSTRPGRYHGAGTPVESTLPPPNSFDSEPPTRIEGRKAGERQEPHPVEYVEQLLSEAQRCHSTGQLDDAVAHAEKLLEMAVYERDSKALRTVASRLPLLDAIFEARVSPMNQHVVTAPMSNRLRFQLSPSAAKLLSRIEGDMSLREIVAESGIPRRDCIRLLAGLLRRGALVRRRRLHG